jgi:hypothetical protein
MSVPQTGLPMSTRRVFCRRIAAAVSTGVFGILATDLGPQEHQSLTDDYVIVNGWVLTRKDALLRQERSLNAL